MWQKVNLLRAFFARFFRYWHIKCWTQSEREKHGDRGRWIKMERGGNIYTVCPRNWRWVNCQLINSTRLAGKCCCYFRCCCCCSLGHQFNVCTLRHRGVGVAVQPACSTASSVTNGWTLKTKLRYAAWIIHRFLIIFHITFVAFCLLPPRIYILMPSSCRVVPCRALPCRMPRMGTYRA